jgi:phospholipid N-methyltransferase
MEDTERMVTNLDRDINHRVDREFEDTHQTFRDVETDLRSQLKSRMDKLTNQIIKKIPPTNDELMKRIEKIEEESYRLRMNM